MEEETTTQAAEEAVSTAAEQAAQSDGSIWTDPAALFEAYGMPLVWAIATFIIGMWIAKAIRGVVRKVMVKRGVDNTLIGFLTSMLYAALMTMVVIAAIGKLGVNTTSFVAILGAAGLAVGFALQGSLSNFASGVMIIIFRPFKAGDFVEAGGATGVVLDVTVFTTTMKTGDNKKIIIPNGAILGGTITNYSAHDTRRVDLVFGIGYDDDIKAFKDLLTRLCNEDDRILKDPAVTIACSELADSSVNFVCRPWVNSADYWGVYFDLTEKVKLGCDEAGISIPFPQQDVHMHQVA